MSMGQFCRANKIKVYYLKRILELYGQKLMPVLRDLSAYSAANASDESLDELWKESRKFIAAEVSDQERVRLKTPSRTSIEFERIRFRLLIDIAMMPYTTKSDKAILFNGKDHEIYNVGTGIPVTLQEQCQAIIDVFSPKDNPSTIEYHPGKSGGGFLMDITNAKEDLGYEPVMDVHKLFEDYKYEAQYDRFKSLRGV